MGKNAEIRKRRSNMHIAWKSSLYQLEGDIHDMKMILREWFHIKSPTLERKWKRLKLEGSPPVGLLKSDQIRIRRNLLVARAIHRTLITMRRRGKQIAAGRWAERHAQFPDGPPNAATKEKRERMRKVPRRA